MKTIVFLFVLSISLQALQYKQGPMHQLAKLYGEELLQIFQEVPVSIDPERIKKTPDSWKYIPFLHSEIASTLTPISPFIYIPHAMFKDIQSGQPDLNTIAVLYHEFTHYERYKNRSAGYALQYLTSRQHRIFEELYAIRTEMEFRDENNLSYDVDRKAKHFAGSVYMWASEYKDAEAVLKTMWESVQD